MAPTLVFCSDCNKQVEQAEEACECESCFGSPDAEIFQQCGVCGSLNITPNTGIGLDGKIIPDKSQ